MLGNYFRVLSRKAFSSPSVFVLHGLSNKKHSSIRRFSLGGNQLSSSSDRKNNLNALNLNEFLLRLKKVDSKEDMSSLIKEASSKKIILSLVKEAAGKEFIRLFLRKVTINENMRYLVKKIFYGFLGSYVLYCIDDYTDTRKELNQIDIDLHIQSLESAALLDDSSALEIKPFLYLATILRDKDSVDYHDTKRRLDQQKVKLAKYQNALEGLERKLKKTFRFIPFTGLIVKNLKEKHKNLNNMTEQQKDELYIAKEFNSSVWLQKNKRYEEALNKIRTLIDILEKKKLEPQESQKDKKTQSALLFDINLILSAAYTTQAKLYACLGKKSKKGFCLEYAENCSKNYEKALEHYEEFMKIKKVLMRWDMQSF